MTDLPAHPAKSDLRRAMRLQRHNMNRRQRANLDRQINRELLLHARKLKVASLGAYWSFDGEPDLGPALRSLAVSGTSIALPVLNEDEEINMAMHRWRPHSTMKKNRFNILQPVEEPRIDLRRVDMLVIPLLAWDTSGNRLGMGSGFYDRMLADVRGENTPLRVGAAYSAQRLDQLPVDSWDVPLHAVVHDEGWFSFDV